MATVTPLMSMNVMVAGRPLNSGWLPSVTRTNGASFTHTGVIAVTDNAPTMVVVVVPGAVVVEPGSVVVVVVVVVVVGVVVVVTSVQPVGWVIVIVCETPSGGGPSFQVPLMMNSTDGTVVGIDHVATERRPRSCGNDGPGVSDAAERIVRRPDDVRSEIAVGERHRGKPTPALNAPLVRCDRQCLR